MTYPVFSNGDALPASDLNAIGLWLVKTQTVGSGVSSVTVSNVFSATYDSYRIVYTGFTGSVSGAAMLIRCVTSGGADNASNWKGNAFYIVTGAAGGLSNSNYTNGASADCSGIDTVVTSCSFDITGPFLTQRTQVNYNNADNAYWRVSASMLDNATSYTGFKLLTNAGTLTGGTIRVYGYRN